MNKHVKISNSSVFRVGSESTSSYQEEELKSLMRVSYIFFFNNSTCYNTLNFTPPSLPHT